MAWFAVTAASAQATIIAALVSGFVSLILAAFNPFAARNLEKLKAQLAGDSSRNLETLKEQLAQSGVLNSARVSYEFEARKKLYTRVEPLLFQLSEATENSFYRVASLVRTQIAGQLGRSQNSWLTAGPGSSGTGLNYYLLSTVYMLFLPLAIYRLIQRSATFLDLTLDPDIRTKYLLLKSASICFTDDHDLADVTPKIDYKPNMQNWQSLRDENPAMYWRQGFVIGRLEQLSDAMTMPEGDQRRPMTYGEFHKAAISNREFINALSPALDVFEGFSFDERPVLGRMLLAQAALMDLLSTKYDKLPERAEMEAALEKFAKSPKAKEKLDWSSKPGSADVWDAVLPYLKKHLDWLYPAT